jgi:competence protein ComEA
VPPSDGLVNVNTATAEELDALPGVGPVTAAAILEFRREHGPFQRVEDLLEVRGIGEKKLERMRTRVVVR